jgi:hypothetical protein
MRSIPQATPQICNNRPVRRKKPIEIFYHLFFIILCFSSRLTAKQNQQTQNPLLLNEEYGIFFVLHFSAFVVFCKN